MSNDEQEVIGDAVLGEAAKLPREGVLDALDKAVGSSKKRRSEAVYVLSQLTDTAEVVDRIREWLKDPDPRWRSWLIQTVEQRGLTEFAPLLNQIIEHDPDPFCRGLAVHAAGTLRADENLPVLLRLAKRVDHQGTWRFAWALKGYARPTCRPYLTKWFKDEKQDKQTRIVAAWGLGKLGDLKALNFLVQMLFDPDREGKTFFNPGESRRAAQALCDIEGWPFKWDKSYVTKTIARVKKSERLQSFLAPFLAASDSKADASAP